MRKSRRISLIAVIAALITGCQSMVVPEEVLSPGLIDPSLSVAQVVQLSPSARAGEELTVTVTTVGSSSCTRPGGAEQRVYGLLAEVTPLDWVPADPQTACTRDLRSFPRDVRLRFATAGEATIRVHGRGHARVVDGQVVQEMISVDARLRIDP